MIVVTEASGDEKSFPLWFDTMVLIMLRKKEHKIAMTQNESDLAAYHAALQKQGGQQAEERAVLKELNEQCDACRPCLGEDDTPGVG